MMQNYTPGAYRVKRCVRQSGVVEGGYQRLGTCIIEQRATPTTPALYWRAGVYQVPAIQSIIDRQLSEKPQQRLARMSSNMEIPFAN